MQVFSASSIMASWAPALRELNKKWGLIWDCRYLRRASFKWFSIRSSRSKSSCSFSAPSFTLATYSSRLPTIWLKVLVTMPISSLESVSGIFTLKFPCPTRLAVLARLVRGVTISFTSILSTISPASMTIIRITMLNTSM